MHFCAAVTGFVALAVIATVPAQAADATFQRDLTITGRFDLTVHTGSGSIHLTSGASISSRA